MSLARIDPIRPFFRAAVKPAFPFAIAQDRLRDAEQGLQSLRFALEIAGADVSHRELIAEMLEDLHQLRMSLPR